MVLNVLHPSIDARYIRVHPKTWRGHISMRMELLGCPSGTTISVFILFSIKKLVSTKSSKAQNNLLAHSFNYSSVLMVLDNPKSRIYNQFHSKSRYALTLSYLQTMGASKIKRELLTNSCNFTNNPSATILNCVLSKVFNFR